MGRERWRRLRQAARYACVGAPLLLLGLGGAYLSRRNADHDLRKAAHMQPRMAWREPRISSVAGVQILQFYATPGVVMQGQKALLCYGVANARQVRIEPPVGQLSPVLNRCIEIHPDHSTRYRIIATGDDGQQVSASLKLVVRLDPVLQPKILDFSVHGTVADHGHTVYQLCFQTEAAERVTVDPPVIPPTSAARGCFSVAPQQTTTYTLTVTGATGSQAERRLTAGQAPPAS